MRDNDWRRKLIYDRESRKMFIPDEVLDILQEQYKFIFRIGEMVGNYIICGIAVDGILLNLHPESETVRFEIPWRVAERSR